jgi:CBS domain-containing protein
LILIMEAPRASAIVAAQSLPISARGRLGQPSAAGRRSRRDVVHGTPGPAGWVGDSIRDEVEAVFGQSIRSVMEKKKLVTVASDATVSETVKLMARKKVSAVMIVDDGRLVGIFTERDAVLRVMAPGRDARTTRMAEVMTTAPKTAAPDRTFGYALLMMHEHGFRHVPVVEDHKLIGIVSARDALNPDLEEFVAEAERRKHIERERA